jgi:hypothetical protein
MSELQIPLSKVGFASKTAKMPFFLPERLARCAKIDRLRLEWTFGGAHAPCAAV